MSKPTHNATRGRSLGKSSQWVALTVAFAALAGTASAQDYLVMSQPQGVTSISGNTNTMDIGANFTGSLQTFQLPFDFEFFGTMFATGSNIVISENNFITFDALATNDTGNDSLPTAGTPNNAIYAMWDATNAGTGTVLVEVQGTAPNRVFVIEWLGYEFTAFNPTNYDTQIALFETSNEIEIRYAIGTTSNGAGWTGGVENAGGTLARGPRTASGSADPTENSRFIPSAGNPDLDIDSFTVTQAQVLPGDTIDVQVSIDNTGTANSTTFMVNAYLSTDNIIDPLTDLDLGAFSASFQIDMGMNQTESQQFTIPMTLPMNPNGRSFFVGVVADVAMTQMEPDLTNNVGLDALLIGPDPYTLQTVAQGPFATIINDVNATIIASSAQGLNTEDDIEFTSMVPFDFPYFGQTVAMGTPVVIGPNGYVELDEANPVLTGIPGFVNTRLGLGGRTSTPEDGVLCPFWDDLNVSAGGTATVATLVTGVTPNQVWTIEFNQLSRTGSSTAGYTAQVVIEESGIIRFNYDGNLAWAGSPTATIGIESLSGGEAVEVTSSGNATVRPNDNFVFVPAGGGGAAVDLVVNSVSGSPSMVNAAGSLMITRELENLGTSDAGMFSVAYYLSTDSTIDTSDILLGSEMVSGLMAGNTMSMMTTVSIPTSTVAGTYFVGAIVNSSGSVIESDFTNNATASAMTIQVLAPGRDQGDLNGDASIDVADVMFCINDALAADPTDPVLVARADLNGDMTVNILDIQATINLVLAAP